MSKPHPVGEHLLVVMAPQLAMALTEASLPESFEIAGERFHDTGMGDFTGFYDWLRDRDGKVVGVRYCPDPSLATTSNPGNLSYVRKDDDCWEILFGSEAAIDRTQSNDQSFGGNRQFRSDREVLAISFETYFLTKSELESIRDSRVVWVTPVIG